MSIEKWAIFLVAVVIAVLLGIAVVNAESRGDYPIRRGSADETAGPEEGAKGREISFDDARRWRYVTPAEDRKDAAAKKDDGQGKKDAAEEKPKPATGPGRTTVGPGETYSHIARRVYGDAAKWRLLAQANPDKPATGLRQGDEIVVPPLPAPAVVNAPPANDRPQPANSARVHQVMSNETLTGISKKYYGTSSRWREILAANPEIKGPNALRSGVEIRIP
ncbi:MAG: LysM peptidoglycan-binding domain-containing protein [Planctomycetota bacterium]